MNYLSVDRQFTRLPGLQRTLASQITPATRVARQLGLPLPQVRKGQLNFQQRIVILILCWLFIRWALGVVGMRWKRLQVTIIVVVTVKIVRLFLRLKQVSLTWLRLTV